VSLRQRQKIQELPRKVILSFPRRRESNYHAKENRKLHNLTRRVEYIRPFLIFPVVCLTGARLVGENTNKVEFAQMIYKYHDLLKIGVKKLIE
jgi:hypothetical protein